MSTNIPAHDLANLSNHDVGLLYDIVSAAEQSTALPFRALFAAYEQVLAKNDIPRDNDQKYLRFLLRMGESRKPGIGLFDQFEVLLAKLGIQVAFDGESRVEAGSADASDKAEDSPSIKRFQTLPFRPARRGSFDSALEANAETSKTLNQLQLLPARPRSFENLSTKHKLQSDSGYIATNSGQPLKSAIHGAQSQPADGPVTRGRLSSKTDRPHETLGRSDQAPRFDGVEDTQELKSNPSPDASSEDGGAESTDESEASDIVDPSPTLQDAVNDPPPPPPAQPTPQQLEHYGKVLRFHHVAANAVKFFRHWRAVAEQSHNQHSALRQTAAFKDATALKRQSFDLWRLAVAEEQQLRETEKFYHSLDIRAGKARGLFLMNKAFTHWAQCASEEVARKTEDRKQVLTAKYFNAWRDMTVVNELKVRRHRLGKFVGTWKKKTGHLLSLEEQAVTFRTSHGSNEAYRSWFWHFCERRAPQWYVTKLQRALFKKWVESARAAHIRTEWATDFRNLELLRVCLVRWTNMSNVVHQSILHAIDFRRRMLMAPTVEAFRRDLRLAPVQAEVRDLVDQRLARSALDTWLSQARNMSQARCIERLRVVKNAWTQWNDVLRCRALSRSVNERIVLHALYKWVLAERLALFERVGKEKLVLSIYSRWRKKTDALSAALGKATYQQREAKERRKRAYILSKWTSLTEVGRQEDDRAVAFRNERLSSSAMQIWTARFRHLRMTCTWAQEARFYLLTTRSIKVWREKATENKKCKRRDAYSAVRRKMKMNLARSALDKLRDASARRKDLKYLAGEAYQQHLGRFVLALISHWHLRCAGYHEATGKADSVHKAQLSSTHLRLFNSRFAQIQDASIRADTFLSESINVMAKNCFRKLEWRLFQCNGLDESAERLGQRNRRNHRKLMLKHWADAASLRRSSQQDKGAQSGLHRNSILSSLSTAARSDQRTPVSRRAQQQHQLVSGHATTRPAPIPSAFTQPVAGTPAYLRTPSRHIVKARATNLVFGPQSQRPLQRHRQNGSVSTLNQKQQTEPRPPQQELQEPLIVKLPRPSSLASQSRDSLFPSTPVSQLPTSMQEFVQPFTQAESVPLFQTNVQRQTQLTPFLSRLRAQYETPTTSGIFRRSDRLAGAGSGLRGEVGASPGEGTDVDKARAGPAADVTEEPPRRGSFFVDADSEGRGAGSGNSEVG